MSRERRKKRIAESLWVERERQAPTMVIDFRSDPRQSFVSREV